jgi:hypothetical protein
MTWKCESCGGETDDRTSLRDHQEWCLGDGLANARLLSDVVRREGALNHGDIVATARGRRLDAEN